MKEGRKNISLLKMMLPAIIILFLFSINVNAQFNKGTLKAAYIERITRFVEWPEKKNSIFNENFIIGVYGETEFYYTLAEVFKDKSIKGLKVKVRIIQRPEQMDTCNLCYLSDLDEQVIVKFVNEANSFGVLLMSETTDFCKEGGHINFYLEDEMLKFEINEKSIESAGFKVSYLLMQNTRIVK
jgi:hypothetical protein